MKVIRVIKKILFVLLFILVACIAVVAAFNVYVYNQSKDYIKTPEQLEPIEADYILVLGAAVRPDGSLSHMLEDRVLTGADLYHQEVAPILLMSGDSQKPEDYDETGHMKDYAIGEGVPPEAIIQDPVGLSTYDSILRAKEQMEGKKVIIVTQKYHLFRAVYIAREMGLEAYGCDAAIRSYAGQIRFTAREWIARCKDVIYVRNQEKPSHGTDISFQKYNGNQE